MSYFGPTRFKPSLASRISIGRAARMTGLTIRAIRYYEERGLVEAQRDARDIRTFDSADIEILMQIVELRAIGISIDDICALAADDALPGGRGDTDRLAELLNDRHHRLSRQLSQISLVAQRAGVEVQSHEARPPKPSLAFQ